MSAQIKPLHVDGTPKRGIDPNAPELPLNVIGELVQYGLDSIDASRKSAHEQDLKRKNLAIAGGASEEPEIIDLKEAEKQRRRTKLLKVAKTAPPELMMKQLCKAASKSRNINCNDCLWLFQSIVSAVCDNAAWEWARRKQETGSLAGVAMEVDDAGVFTGFESRDNTIDEARDNRTINPDSPFSKIDSAEEIENLFLDWYRSIEVQLMAMADAAFYGVNNIVKYGHHIAWIETGEVGNSSRVQHLSTFEDKCLEALTGSNDRQTAVAANKEANVFSAAY